MTLIRKLASALCLVFLFTTLSSNAQIDSTTGNLINSGTAPTDTTSTWNNGVYVDQLCFGYGQPGNCGPNPSIRAASGSINFSYGTVDLNQVVNINRALAAGGTGVQLSGFNFSFMAKNGNGWDDARQDYLAAYIKFYNAGGSLAANYDYSAQTNQRYNWTAFNFNETFANPTAASNYSNAQVGFVGRDNNFWAGNYGPEIYNVAFSLKYRVDPCATNPAYSPNCSGFKDVLTSSNLVPYPDSYAYGGYSIDQSYAINTALAKAGSAAQIHGFQWGYVANTNGPYCNSWDMGFMGCWDFRTPSVSTNVNITNASGASLYNVSREYQNSYNTTNYSYLFPSSQTMSTLGNFNFTATTNDQQAYIGSMWSRALYTADPCAVNPLSSPTCSGYGAAFAKTLQSSSTTSTTAAYTGTTSVTPTSQIETSPAGVIDQTSPTTVQQTSSSTSTVSSSTSSTTAATQESTQTAATPTADPAQPASTTPTPAGGPAQTTATASASSSTTSSSGGGGGAGPSKLAMSVLKSAQEKDKATQTAAVASAAKTLENATQSSQASSNMAITMNQDMSANSAVAAATFASQTTQASQQVATQVSQGSQQTAQTSTQTQQTNRQGPQSQQQQQDTQQTQVQSAGVIQMQAPQQQDTQQAQAQTSTSVVKLLAPQPQEQQQSQSQMSAGMMQPQQTTYTAPQQQQQDTQSAQVTMLKPPTQPVVEIQQQASTGTGLTVGRNPFAYNPLMSSSTSITAPVTQSTTMYQPKLDTKQLEVEVPQMQVASFGGVGKAGNPLSEMMMQQRFEMMQDNITQPTSSVNRNVQPNDLAGKVDLTAMAVVPAGFNTYSFVLRDAAFYEPKEVYKNQKTVDNVRLLRGLTGGSDALHQQMVDSQYK